VKRGLSLWLPVVVYMAAIFFASAISDPPVPSDVPDVDLHMLAYFGLMMVVVRAVSGGVWTNITITVLLIAWCITVAYGASDEWHQVYVPNRHAELRDLGADAIGAAAAAIVLKAWGILRRL
jgi:VanZ family protein